MFDNTHHSHVKSVCVVMGMSGTLWKHNSPSLQTFLLAVQQYLKHGDSLTAAKKIIVLKYKLSNMKAHLPYKIKDPIIVLRRAFSSPTMHTKKIT